MESPLFDSLWPVILDAADCETQDNLHLTHSYFKNMWEHADTQHKSDAAKDEYKRMIALPSESQLACHSDLWYSWGAQEARFGSQKGFYEFCAIAGVDPESGRLVDPEDEDLGWVFLSADKDLTFRTANHPLGNQRWIGCVHDYGCTGERTKSLKLEEWWLENGDSGRMSRGTRYVDPINGETF